MGVGEKTGLTYGVFKFYVLKYAAFKKIKNFKPASKAGFLSFLIFMFSGSFCTFFIKKGDV